MKPTNLIITIFCVLLCALGWFTMVSDNASVKDEYKDTLSLAEEYMEQKLYQRAIKEYMVAFDSQNTLEVAEKIVEAYELRYKEAKVETYDDYVGALKKLTAVYPDHEDMALKLANLYLEEEDYKKSFACLQIAANNGAESKELLDLLRKCRYAFTLRNTTYDSVSFSTETSHTVCQNGLWGIHSVDSSIAGWQCKYPFISQSSPDGVVLVTFEEDSRLIDSEGMVLGIFEKIITDAGIYNEGLIPAYNGKDYGYYDEFAKLQFGGYEFAGTFINGEAAVKKDGKWVLIDTVGDEISDTLEEIVLNTKGEHISGSYMLVAEKAGEYKVYNQDWEEVADLKGYSAVDILTEDGVIAVCKDGKWGFVDVNGEEIIKPEYEAARSFSNGLAAVCKDGKWGFIDMDNNLVIACTFLKAGYFNGAGTTMVCTNINEVTIPEEPVEDAGQDEAAEPAEADNTQEEAAEEAENEEEPKELKTELVETWALLKLHNGIVED